MSSIILPLCILNNSLTTVRHNSDKLKINQINQIDKYTENKLKHYP